MMGWCSRLRILYLLMLVLLWAGKAQAVPLQIELTGVDGLLRENIQKHLRVIRQQDVLATNPSRLQRLHRLAEGDILAALKPLGYYNPVVTSQIERGEELVRLQYHVDPGPPMVVEAVHLELTGEGRTNKIILGGVKTFPLKIGDILRQDFYEKGKKDLANLAFGEGYLDAAFSRATMEIDRDRNLARVALSLDTGRQFYFGETTSAQQVIRPLLLQGYLPYQEGEPYRPAKLARLQAALYRTGFFGRVAVSGIQDAGEGNSVPVKVELEEVEKKNQYSFGVGYASDTGAKVRFDWQNRLLNDRGHSIRSAFLLAELETQINLTYLIPLEEARTNTLFSNLNYQDRSWQDTQSELFSLAMSRSSNWELFNLDTTLAYRRERYRVGDQRDQSELLIPGLNVGYVLADDFHNIKYGHKATFGFLGAKEGVLADTDFLQTTVDGKLILSPLQQWRLIGRGTLGYTLVDEVSSIPPSLRFYAGGDSTIRGYKYKSIGPKDDQGNVVGGNYLVIGSVELERRLTDAWSLAAFWDVGTATDDLSEAMHQGMGGGVRFQLPFGQLRLDLANAVTEPDKPWRLHFTVGGTL